MKRIIKLFLGVAIILGCSGSIAVASEYRLDTGDVLEISVWGFEGQKADSKADSKDNGISIRPDGKIAFPLVGEVQAAGLSPAELTQVLTTGLSQYLVDPRVTVNILKYRTTRVYVLGEVLRPGMFEIERQHNLLDAIGIAGGYTKDAAKKKVFIIHKDQKAEPVKANLWNLLNNGDMTQNYTLNDGDVVYLSSNNRIDFSRDILPFLAGTYYIDQVHKK